MVVSMVYFYRVQQELTLSVLFVEIRLFSAEVFNNLPGSRGTM